MNHEPSTCTCPCHPMESTATSMTQMTIQFCPQHQADGSTGDDWQYGYLALLPQPGQFPLQVLIPGTGATFPKGFSPGQSYRPQIRLPPRLFGQRSKCAKTSSLWSFPPFLYFPPLGVLHWLRGFFTRCSMTSYLPSLPPPPVFPCRISPTSQRVCPQVVFHWLAHLHSPK